MIRWNVIGISAIFTLSVSTLLAAPGARPKEEKLPPPTAAQLQQAEENLKNIAIAFHNYHDTNGVMPTNVLAKDKKPLLSWRVQILPYIEADELYKQFKLDEPWDSEHNKKLIDKMPKLYEPIRVKCDSGLTFYQTFTGTNGWMKTGASLPRSFPDGTSNTLLVAESARPVVWTKPDDLVFDGKKLPDLGGMFDGKFHAAFGDGSSARFRKGLDIKLLGRLIDPADGEVVDRNDALDDGDDKR